ncbi:MAG: SCP2 sterol-binding domain-containing protein [Deltaproteobacteria bacterium]
MNKQRDFDNVDAVIAGMRDRFLPDRCRDLQASVHWRLTGEEPREFTVAIDKGTFDVKPGPVDHADLTMETSSETYLRLANGELSGTVAIMTRKLRVRGRLQLAARWDRLFSA